MEPSKQDRSWMPGIDLWMTLAAFLLALLMIVLATQLHAQTFTVLHAFTGGADGANPVAGLTMDKGGNLYGTASAGAVGFGTVFKLAHSGSGWTFSPLYQFQGGADGATPMAALVFGPDGSLYSTTEYGGTQDFGTVFNLRPSPTRPKSVFSPWVETVIHSFTFWTDGALPFSEVVFDAAGNLYGTTYGGGENVDYARIDGGSGCSYHCGVVYELSPSNGGWTETTIFQFSEDSGANPYAGLVFDAAGNLDGATLTNGLAGLGSAFQLTPSGSGWTEKTLHTFEWAEGTAPFSTPILDSAGVLYAGNTGYSGYYGTYNGNVFTLKPNGEYWSFFSLYAFPPKDGPYGGLTMDAAGNLYGTTASGGANGYGSVFKLTPFDGGWNYTSLHDFTGPDGCQPKGKVVLDANGNLYGTTSLCGGTNGYGNVWEITP
jgi:uncharacterized repeat protein (TIGR03803 family)